MRSRKARLQTMLRWREVWSKGSPPSAHAQLTKLLLIYKPDSLTYVLGVIDFYDDREAAFNAIYQATSQGTLIKNPEKFYQRQLEAYRKRRANNVPGYARLLECALEPDGARSGNLGHRAGRDPGDEESPWGQNAIKAMESE